MRFSDLTAGYELPSTVLALDAQTVERYLRATEDDNALYWHDGAVHLVPPLAVAALALRGIAQEVALAPGSLHTGQELLFRRLVTSAGARRAAAVETPVEARQPVAYPTLAPPTLEVGRQLGPLVRMATQERIDQYAAASGDYNPIHVDPAFAARSPFGGTVAHGMLLLAYVSTLLTQAFGRAWLQTGALRVKFRNPAPAGTTVTAQGWVERLEEGHGVQYAVCAVRLENAAGEALLSGEARVDVKKVP
jgi:3-hydroxybutyryl-CoA dehydratase